MQKSNLIKRSALAGILSLAVAGAVSESVLADAATKGKCYGGALAHKNDCQGPGHSCAGQAKTDYDINEWKLMTEAECQDIAKEQDVKVRFEPYK